MNHRRWASLPVAWLLAGFALQANAEGERRQIEEVIVTAERVEATVLLQYNNNILVYYTYTRDERRATMDHSFVGWEFFTAPVDESAVRDRCKHPVDATKITVSLKSNRRWNRRIYFSRRMSATTFGR